MALAVLLLLCSSLVSRLSSLVSRLSSLAESRFAHLFGARRDVGRLVQQPGASIPAEDRVIVSGGSDRFGLLVPIHCLAQLVVGGKAGARGPLVEPGLGDPLADQAGIIRPLIWRREICQRLASPPHRAHVAAELVRLRQELGAERRLIARIHRRNIPADALRRPGLIEEAVLVRFLERRRNTRWRKMLEFKHGSASRNRRDGRRTGRGVQESDGCPPDA